MNNKASTKDKIGILLVSLFFVAYCLFMAFTINPSAL